MKNDNENNPDWLSRVISRLANRLYKKRGRRMSKELEYEVNNFANLLNKDCMNLMECLKKQSEDNKPILYIGKHYKKVILPYEEYQKMCNRLESIDNAEPSEALDDLEKVNDYLSDVYDYKEIKEELRKDIDNIKQALLKAQIEHKALETIKEYFIFKFDREEEPDGNVWGLLVSIQAKEDEGNWDCTATANLAGYEEEFNTLKETLK